MNSNKLQRIRNDILLLITPILIIAIHLARVQDIIQCDSKFWIFIELIFWLYLSVLFGVSYRIGNKSNTTRLIIKGCERSPGIDGKLASYLMSFVLFVIAILQFLYLSGVI